MGIYYYTVTYKYAAYAPAFVKSDLEIIVNAPSSSDSASEEDETDAEVESEASVGANASASSAAEVFANVETKLEDELRVIFSLG